MKISPQQYEKVMAIYQNQQRKAAGTEEPKARDTLSLSREARAVKEVRELLQQTPEVREEKVAELKEKISSGEYQVPGEEVAEKMLQRMAVDFHLLNRN